MRVLVIDIGTTIVKAFLMEETGRIVGRGSQRCEINYPYPTFAEQNPDCWFEVVNKIKDKYDFIIVTAQRSTFVLMDKRLNRITDAILWLDNRHIYIPMAERAKVKRRFILEKLLWFREKSSIWGNIGKILPAESYFIYKLTGKTLVDPTIAIYLGYNPIKNEWDYDLLSQVGIDESILPEVVHPGTIVGEFNGAKVIMGAGDQNIASVGLGVLDKASAKVTLGTGGFLNVYSAEPLFDFYDERTHLYMRPHAIPNKWLLEGVIYSASSFLDWFIREFSAAKSYSELDVILAKEKPGSDGLISIPLPTFSKGAFINFSLSHGKSTFLRSLIEGICFAVKYNVEMSEKLVGNVSRLRLDGGLSKSTIIPQILADITGKPIDILSSNIDAAAYGALILAISSIRGVDAKKVFNEIISVERTYLPESKEAYEENYNIFREEYEKRLSELGL